jgi:hypothetical protein
MQHFYLNESGAPYFVSDEIRQEDFVAAGDRRQAKAN